MGTVWRAHHAGLDREVAVKVVSTEGRDGQNLARLRREARLAARLSCPHVVRVMDVGEHEGRPYLVMERLVGASLAERLEGGQRLAPAEVAELLRQLAIALEAAHREGIVHRDVKPANVFLLAGDRLSVKLLDFGVARSAEPASALTQTGAMVGTVHYMSPEQLRGGPVDAGADLWALAVVAYRALTGRLPFAGATVAEVAMAVERGGFAPPSSVVAGLGPTVDAWFKRALCRNRRLRFTHPGELAEAFAEALVGDGDALELPAGADVAGDAETLDAPQDPLLAPAAAPRRRAAPLDRAPEPRPRPGRVPAARVLAWAAGVGLVGAAIAIVALDRNARASRAATVGLAIVAPPSIGGLPADAESIEAGSKDAASTDAASTDAGTIDAESMEAGRSGGPRDAGPEGRSAPPQPPGPPPPVTVTASPAPSPTSSSAPGVDCRQPFRIDAHGDYHPRPECL